MLKIGFAHSLVATLSMVCLPLAMAQTQVEIEEEGRIIRIGPDGSVDMPQQAPQPLGSNRPNWQLPPSGHAFFGSPIPQSNPLISNDIAALMKSKFMIGISAEKIGDQLRAHVDLPESEGLVARIVVEGSPAAQAGVKQHDILLAVNDKTLTGDSGMADLVEAVESAGKEGKSVTIKVLRKGESLSIEVTPTKRDKAIANVATPISPNAPQLAVPADAPTFMWRGLGPAVRLGGQPLPPADVPDGVSISIKKQNDEPTQITIQRGEETYEIAGDDKEALEKLPEDLRPLAERMLNGNAVFQAVPGVGNALQPIPGVLPDAFRLRVEQNRAKAEAAADDARARMDERMAEMEARIQELHERISRRMDERNSAAEDGASE